MNAARLRALMGPLDRPDLAIPLALFTAAGIATSFWFLPEQWGILGRLGAGVVIGVSSWMFPYLNRALQGDDE